MNKDILCHEHPMSSRNAHTRSQCRGVGATWLSLFACGALFVASLMAANQASAAEGKTVWGNIERYTDSYIVVGGTRDRRGSRYQYAKHVIIDTYSLKKNKHGNVRITLDANGKAKEIFFYGIDMPEVVGRYKK